MTPEKILARPPKVLTHAQREQYFEQGYLVLQEFVPQDWLQHLRQVTDQFVEESRAWSESDDKFDLEPDHTAKSPRLRRLSWPTMHHDTYWAFASHGPIVDVAEDLLGADVAFHHSKLNFKWFDGGEEVKWHQDFPFYPHSNASVLAIGLYLNDVDDEMGPMGAIPGSQDGPIYDHYREDGEWAGAVREDDAKALATSTANWMTGKAGTITVHHCRTVHGSMPNHSTRMRPLLINAYKSADARSLTSYPDSACVHHSSVVRGEAARWADVSVESCRLPPDWSQGYTSIFALQQDAKETRRATT